MLERHAAAQGLSIAQTRLLGILRDRRPTMNELARLLELDKSSVTGLVDRAERRGLVARTPAPRDGRSVIVELTDEGRVIVTRAAASFAEEVGELLGRLTPSARATLSQLIERVLVDHAAVRGVDLHAIGTP
jgi:DNA-binding MarR family transcriptional regulator